MSIKLDYSDIRFKNDGRLKLLIIVGTRPEIIRLAAVIGKCRTSVSFRVPVTTTSSMVTFFCTDKLSGTCSALKETSPPKNSTVNSIFFILHYFVTLFIVCINPSICCRHSSAVCIRKQRVSNGHQPVRVRLII